MSIIMAIICLILIIVPQTDAATKAAGISILGTIGAAWFIPGAAKQIINEIQKTQPPQPPRE